MREEKRELVGKGRHLREGIVGWEEPRIWIKIRSFYQLSKIRGKN